jgi:hypothetical protein
MHRCFLRTAPPPEAVRFARSQKSSFPVGYESIQEKSHDRSNYCIGY